jgi:hypothetical protein
MEDMRMKVWLDDKCDSEDVDRTAPKGWIGVKTADEVITLLKTRSVAELSLDHDFGGRGDRRLWIRYFVVAGERSCYRRIRSTLGDQAAHSQPGGVPENDSSNREHQTIGGRGGDCVKVYLDDSRETPEGWIRTFTVEETIALLRLGSVVALDLYHHLGVDAEVTTTGIALMWTPINKGING